MLPLPSSFTCSVAPLLLLHDALMLIFTIFHCSRYVAYIKPSLLELALNASNAVLKQWGGSVSDITHIVFCTMTGSITAPTLDTVLCRELGLRGDIKRVNIENMGCLGGFKSLSLANELAIAKADNIVLTVVCDIRSALVSSPKALAV